MKEYADLLKRSLLNILYAPDDMFRHHISGKGNNKIAHTMIGWKRLTNVEECIHKVIEEGIEGDMIECGVWQGGTCIFMRAILNMYNDTRSVWCADSFEGCPPNQY